MFAPFSKIVEPHCFLPRIGLEPCTYIIKVGQDTEKTILIHDTRYIHFGYLDTIYSIYLIYRKGTRYMIYKCYMILLKI